MSKIKKIGKIFNIMIVLLTFFLLPVFSTLVFAETGGIDNSVAQGNIVNLFEAIYTWLGLIFWFLMTLAVAVFSWGVIKFISSSADAKKREESKWLLIYGVIGLFAISSVYGLIYFIGLFFGIQPGGMIDLPSGGYVNFEEGKPTGIVNTPNDFFEDCDIGSPLGSFKNLACFIGHYLAFIPQILFLFALIYFVWGVIRFMQAGNTNEKISAKSAIVYGIIALAVMASVWGLVVFLKSGLGIN